MSTADTHPTLMEHIKSVAKDNTMVVTMLCQVAETPVFGDVIVAIKAMKWTPAEILFAYRQYSGEDLGKFIFHTILRRKELVDAIEARR